MTPIGYDNQITNEKNGVKCEMPMLLSIPVTKQYARKLGQTAKLQNSGKNSYTFQPQPYLNVSRAVIKNKSTRVLIFLRK